MQIYKQNLNISIKFKCLKRLYRIQIIKENSNIYRQLKKTPRIHILNDNSNP